MASRASRSAPVDGFRLTFDRFGTPGAVPVVLLQGWPGTRHDYRRLVPQLAQLVLSRARSSRGGG